jgi:glutamate/tyrosine decarboxylase-like PLP-dependent enzyme
MSADTTLAREEAWRGEEFAARPELPEIEFDFDDETWRRVGERFLEVAIAASTDWDRRRPTPDVPAAEVKARLTSALPERGTDPMVLAERLLQDLLPLGGYNGHPRWFPWITSSANPVGVLASLVAAAMNQNTALWRAAPGASTIELQTIDWIRELVGFPKGSEGIFSSGGQLANTLAHAVARDRMAGWDVRRHGARGPDGAPGLRVYASDQSHYCHEQSMELMGLGRDAIRLVPSDDSYRMRLDALESMVAEDRSRGLRPISVVAAAGTVGTGAVDPIGAIVRLGRDQGMWVHVDGAYGAFAAIAPSAPEELAAMGEADSLACDPHKWLYAPIDAAVTLFREPGRLAGSFAFHAAYLQAGADPDQADLLERSPENSRPFRALKVWLGLLAYGRAGYAAMIERNIRLAAYLEESVRVTPGLVLAAPRELSIVCWRVEPEALATDPERLEALQGKVIAELERRGIAVVSNATLRDGRTALRACIVNIRTTAEDVEAVVEASRAIGEELAAAS